MLLRYFVWILEVNIQKECFGYDSGRDANSGCNLLMNGDKGQDVVSVLALVRVHGNHDPCLEPAM